MPKATVKKAQKKTTTQKIATKRKVGLTKTPAALLKVKANNSWNAPERIVSVVDRRFKDKVNDITAVLVLYESGRLGLGVSKLNPADKYDRRTAVRTAVRRAQPNVKLDEMVLALLEGA